MRRSTALRLISASAVALLPLVLPAGAQACSCATTGSAREDARTILEFSDGAFIGKLRSVRAISPDRSVFRYRVAREFQTKLGAHVKVESSTSSASCGLNAVIGQRVALGIVKSRGSWTSNLCSYMKPRALRAVAGGAGARRGADAGGACA
jgi:hypothetical protein